LSLFKRRRFPVEIILLCVRWYCKYEISYLDLAEMMRERGVCVDPFTTFRRVQRYAPEIEMRIHRYQGFRSGSWRVDETYVRVGKGFEIIRMIRRGHCSQREGRATGDNRLVSQLFGLAA
jgi:transposase-like protein